MSVQPVIDAFEFAESGRTLRGSAPLSEFPRLRDVLAEARGALEYEVSGVRDDKGRQALRVRINCLLQVRCQRCLEALELPVDLDATLVLAGSMDEMEAQPLDVDGADWVLAGKDMRLGELLEDELLLAVPYAPRHDRCGKEDGNSAAGAGTSPFVGLCGLIGDPQQSKGTKQG